MPGVRSYSTVRACLLEFIVCESHVRQTLGVVHNRAPSAHGLIERVLLQTEQQHTGVVFIVFTAGLQAVRSRHKYSGAEPKRTAHRRELRSLLLSQKHSTIRREMLPVEAAFNKSPCFTGRNGCTKKGSDA